MWIDLASLFAWQGLLVICQPIIVFILSRFLTLYFINNNLFVLSTLLIIFDANRKLLM